MYRMSLDKTITDTCHPLPCHRPKLTVWSRTHSGLEEIRNIWKKYDLSLVSPARVNHVEILRFTRYSSQNKIPVCSRLLIYELTGVFCWNLLILTLRSQLKPAPQNTSIGSKSKRKRLLIHIMKTKCVCLVREIDHIPAIIFNFPFWSYIWLDRI